MTDGPRSGPPPRGASHELIEHTADVGIKAWGPSLADAFEHAVWGLVDVLGAHAERVDEKRVITLTATDREALLIDLLNELIAMCDTEDASLASVRVTTGGAHELRAEVGIALGSTPDGLAVKAATYHAISVAEAADGAAEVVVFLDV